jgi:hypothetical protein
LLGIALEGKRLTAAVVHRAGNRLEVRQTYQASLSLDPLTDDPELVGREIRNHLESARIRERRCAVCVPLNWTLMLRTEVPDLSETDVDGFLSVQAEREFPFAPEDLSLSISRYCTSEGAEHATIVAIPSNHLAVLQEVLAAAKLRPVSITLGITSLVKGGGGPEEGELALLLGENGVDLGVFAAGGGVVALRPLDETIETEPDGKSFDVETIAREMRISLGQMPQDLRDVIRTVKVYGPANLVEPVLEELEGSVTRMGMSAERGDPQSEGLGAASDAIRQMSPTALAVAARSLLGESADLEFLPPKPSRFKAVAGRVSTRGALWLAGAAAAFVVALTGTFLLQHWRLSRLESQWVATEPIVVETEAMQQKVRQFRLWFDESPQGLLIARELTEAFPDDGAVWARRVEIRNLLEVSCSGNARSDVDWLEMLDDLRETKGVQNLQVSQVQGESPLRFTLSFHWNSGESDDI